MVDVVQVDAADRLHQQVVEARRIPGDLLGQLGVVGLEGPADEGAEAVHLVLQLADAAQVLDPLVQRLDVAPHHRGGGAHAEAVSGAHDAEPLVRRRLGRRDDAPHAVDQDLRAAAGQGIEPRIAQARQRLGRGQTRLAGDVLHLARRERMQVDRIPGLDRSEQVLVPLDAELGVVAALHQQRGAAQRQRLLDLLEDHRARQGVALAGVTRPPVERAEVAVRVADVGVVQVPVDDERDLIGRRLATAKLVGSPPDRDQLAGREQRACVVVADPLARQRLVEHLGNGAGAHVDGHQATRSTSTKRSSGTVSSSPARCASSKNRCMPCRSRGPKW